MPIMAPVLKPSSLLMVCCGVVACSMPRSPCSRTATLAVSHRPMALKKSMRDNTTILRVRKVRLSRAISRPQSLQACLHPLKTSEGSDAHLLMRLIPFLSSVYTAVQQLADEPGVLHQVRKSHALH